MKQLKVLWIKKVFGGFLLFAQFAGAAAQMDARTRLALIEKLTGVYLNLAPADQAKVPVTLRLADLHAEKARLDALEESQGSVSGVATSSGKEDRKKALNYYKEVVDKLQEASQFRVRMQIGHLQEMLGQDAEAQKTYEALLKSAAPPEVRAEAQLALGEFFYKRRQFPQAKIHFSELSQNAHAASRGLAAYRAAWCDLNTGALSAAIQGIKNVLKNPVFLSRNSSAENPVIDRQFHEEVSRDYVTFLARGNVQAELAQEVYDLSPESTRLSNIVYLASELERVGQRQSSIQVWRMALNKQSSPMARLEASVHLAQLEMLVGNRPAAIQELESSLKLWTAVQPCADADLCKEIQSRIKGFLVDWNKVEAQKPSAELLTAYQHYIDVFPQSEVALWAAKVATQQKDYKVAYALYSKAAEIEKQSEPKKPNEKLEVALVGAMESAELAQDLPLKEASYTQYLTNSRDKKRELEVLYQRAKLTYDGGDPVKAAEAMREVALSPLKNTADKKSEPIFKQAADLALDALVLAKNDVSLELWAKEFATKFPSHSAEFSKIARTAVLNQVAQDGANGSPDLERKWNVLSRFELLQASPQEQMAFHKNRLVLAEKLKKFREAREAADRLAQIPGVPTADLNFALERRAWLSEMIFDFEGAYSATVQQKSAQRSEEEWLKLALYAELAQKDALPAYREYLKVSKDKEKKALIAAEIVKLSPEKIRAKELQTLKPMLLENLEVYSELALELYVQSPDAQFLKAALAVPGLPQTRAGKVLVRTQLLNDFEAIQKNLVGHKLDGSNQKKMVATLKRRVELLNEMEKMATRAVNASDWTTQLLTLQFLGAQSERFYSELMSLPIPAGLSGEDEQAYLQALSQQAGPYQIKAKDIQAKVSEFWSQEKALDQLQVDYKSSYGSIETLLKKEAQLLKDAAPENLKQRFAFLGEASPKDLRTLSQQNVHADLKELEKARQAVRESPQNAELVKELIQVEKKMGHTKMVSYLEGRLSTSGGSVN